MPLLWSDAHREDLHALYFGADLPNDLVQPLPRIIPPVNRIDFLWQMLFIVLTKLLHAVDDRPSVRVGERGNVLRNLSLLGVGAPQSRSRLVVQTCALLDFVVDEFLDPLPGPFRLNWV